MMLLKDDAQQAMLQGINELADMVAATMGPGGSTIFINRMGAPHLTKDGVTVAKNCVASNAIADMGMQYLVGAAKASVKEAGDGTTTTTVMARNMIVNGINYTAGKTINKHRIARHMLDFANRAIAVIEQSARKVSLEDDLMKSIAMISTNGDESMSDTVLGVLKEVGPKPEAVTMILDDNIEKDVVTIHKGFQIKGRIDAAIIGPYRTRTLKGTKEGAGAIIYTCDLLDKEISLTGELLDYIEKDLRSGHAVLFVGSQLTSDFKRGIANITSRRDIGYVVPNLHGTKFFGLINDINRLGAGEDLDLESAVVDGVKQFNITRAFAKQVTVFKDRIMILGLTNEGTEIHQEVLADVQELIDTSTSAHDRAMLRERMAVLTNGIAEIRVAGIDEQERVEREDRFDDCIRAVCTAVKTGVTVGGGINFARLSRTFNGDVIDVDDTAKRIARDIMVNALMEPINIISKNAVGYSREIPFNDLGPTDTIHAMNGKIIDGYKDGVLDPTGVQTAAIKAATQAAGIFLTTGGVIYGKAETI